MLKPSFYIQCGDYEATNSSVYRLFMEIGTRSFGYVLLDTRKMRPLLIKHFDIDIADVKASAESIREIIEEDELLTRDINEIIVMYGFSESSLVPAPFFTPAISKELTELMYGNLSKDVILAEKIPWWEMHNVYRVPLDAYSFMQKKFKNASSWHLYSLLLKSHKMFSVVNEQDLMKLCFYNDKIVMTIFKGNRLQIIQSFIFQDPKDVLYAMLNVARQFDMDPQHMQVELSGRIDKHSVLYGEIVKYFAVISFEKMDDTIKIPEELNDYPLHYFSSLLKMSVCV